MKDHDDFETKDIAELECIDFLETNCNEITTKDKMYLVKGDRDESVD